MKLTTKQKMLLSFLYDYKTLQSVDALERKTLLSLQDKNFVIIYKRPMYWQVFLTPEGCQIAETLLHYKIYQIAQEYKVNQQQAKKTFLNLHYDRLFA
jgi:hypothetical protein